MGTIFALIMASLAVLVLVSYGVEARRPRPTPPRSLAWDPRLSIQYADLSGIKVRYVKSGAGPDLILLHTLRTQLDIFQKLIPLLAERFTVFAFDYPGHGWSDIPAAEYAPEDFIRWTSAFLDAVGVERATLAGVSIGGTTALVLAARSNPRVARVVAINPYDYWPLGGIRKSSLMARLILGPTNVPVLGATLMRLRTRFVFDRIMLGGVADPQALPVPLAREVYEVGARPGQYQGFLNLLANENYWAEARKEYAKIRTPVLLVYGEQDWAPEAARKKDSAIIPDVIGKTVGGGHFLPLDSPRQLTDLILEFVSDLPAKGVASA